MNERYDEKHPVSDEMLNAFLDGELEREENVWILDQIGKHPKLAQQANRLLHTKEFLRSAYMAALPPEQIEQNPQAMASVATVPTAPTASTASFSSASRQPRWLPRRKMANGAIAAMLVAGFFLGTGMNSVAFSSIASIGNPAHIHPNSTVSYIVDAIGSLISDTYPRSNSIQAISVSQPETGEQKQPLLEQQRISDAVSNVDSDIEEEAGIKISFYITTKNSLQIKNLLENIKQLLIDTKNSRDKSLVELVVDGDSLDIFQAIASDSTYQNQLQGLHSENSNVHFHLVACLDTIDTPKGKEYKKSITWINDVDVINSSIIRVIRRHKEGWSYIRI